MKNEIIQKLEALLQNEDITAIKGDVKMLRADWNSESAKEVQLQHEAWKQEEHDEGEDFKPTPNPLDETFHALVLDYKARVKEYGQRIAEEQKTNMEAKKQLLGQLQALIADEENIGKAFQAFNSIKEEWDKIGNVPGDKYRELADQYYKLREDFFYNINIYKELKENDLKINEKNKQELILKATKLEKIVDLKELEMLVRSYKKQWLDVGPSPRESYQEMGDAFFGFLRTAQERIQGHYDGMRAEQDANLEKKKALADAVRQIVSLEITQHPTWVKKTEEVLELQKNWKTIGFANKKENELVWQEFRGLCDLFFERKQLFYDSRKEEYKKHKEEKENLVSKAEALRASTDWKQTGDALIQLQKEWKAAGPTSQGDEQKLWKRFRAACDEFFETKKKHFSGQDEEQKENYKLKQALIKEIETTELSGNPTKDLEMLREFSSRWNKIGFVPRKHITSVMDRYHETLDAKYKVLKVERSQKNIGAYKERISSLNSGPDGDTLIRKEKHILKDKMNRLQTRVIQFENNLEFLTGSGAESMRKEYEKKIDANKREIDELHKKIQMLNK
jgi:hypothetical protein